MNRRDQLIRDLNSRNTETAVRAAQELQSFPDSVVVQALGRSLHQKDLELAFAAARTLAVLGDRSATKDLVKALEDNGLEKELNDEMRRLLKRGDMHGFAALTEQFGSEIIRLKELIITILFVWQTPEALLALDRAQRSQSDVTKLALQNALLTR